MAYEKQNWQTGDVITADKLNHIEEGLVNSVGDRGFECTEDYVTLTDESVTTVNNNDYRDGALVYSECITADTIKVTFDGTEYICENVSTIEGQYEYGAPYNGSTGNFDWSEYPFNIVSTIFDDTVNNTITTETSGTYQVKIEALSTITTTTPCFVNAVRAAQVMPITKFVVTFEKQGANAYVANRTYEQVRNAYENGIVVEGAYKVSADGEILTYVCTLAEINNSGLTFIGNFFVTNNSINAYQFSLYDNNTVDYHAVTINKSN